MKELTVKQLREKYPMLDKWITDDEERAVKRSDENYKEMKHRDDKIRSLEADLRVEKVKREAVEKQLHYEYESFWRRAVSIAEQY